MSQQRVAINDHLRDLSTKVKEIESIIAGINLVEQRLLQIQQNEEAYLHKQMQQFYNQVDIEEQVTSNNWNDDSGSSGS